MPAKTPGYTVGKENIDLYPNVFGNQVNDVLELLNSGKVSREQANMLLGILSKKASSDIKREIDSMVHNGRNNKALFLRYSWNG